MTIKEIRSKANMTQKEFAEYFNIPYRTIQNWETGHRNPPEYVVELIKYKAEKERLGMLKLVLRDEGKKETLMEGTLEEVVKYLKDNYSMFGFIWEGITEENRINRTTPYEELEGEERELFINKMPQLEDVETLNELKYELRKVDLSWWTLEVEEI